MRAPRVSELARGAAAGDSDIIPISQADEAGHMRTVGMPWSVFVQRIVDRVNVERQSIVDDANRRFDALDRSIARVDELIAVGATKQELSAAIANLSTVTWDQVQGKPGTYQPVAHRHPWTEVDGKPATYAPAAHSHGIAEITGLQAALDAKQVTMAGNITITQNALVVIAAGVRKVDVPLAGGVVGANYLLFPAAATPAGYGLIDCVCVTAGQLQVTLIGPSLALGASYSIPARVLRVTV